MISTTALPMGYIAGTWALDPVHSEVGFAVRHMMVSKVRGRFRDVEAEITTGDDPATSSVTATIAMASIDTGNSGRDDHLRSADFFDVDTYPTMTYRGSGIRERDGQLVLDGELTITDITRKVPLIVDLTGFGADPSGIPLVGFTATTAINRRDFNVNFNMPLPGGNVAIGDQVEVFLDIQARQVGPA